MRKIIGIHGLANKPEKNVLEQWWKQSIREGLENIGASDIEDIPFRMVYWADLLYKNPQHQDAYFTFDSLYNDEPYMPAGEGAIKEYEQSFYDSMRSATFDSFGSCADALKVHLGVDALADRLLSRLLRDLNFYYDGAREICSREGRPEKAQTVLRDELQTALHEEEENDLLLVAHSMGSIIAYDVLRDLGRSDAQPAIHHLVTIGSPLGLPHVKCKIIQERDYDARVRTPSVVSRGWTNFADRKDPVAMDIHLGDDYTENRHHVCVVDDLVTNDYRSPANKENHHKSYGYLRTPEFSRLAASFLRGE